MPEPCSGEDQIFPEREDADRLGARASSVERSVRGALLLPAPEREEVDDAGARAASPRSVRGAFLPFVPERAVPAREDVDEAGARTSSRERSVRGALLLPAPERAEVEDSERSDDLPLVDELCLSAFAEVVERRPSCLVPACLVMGHLR